MWMPSFPFKHYVCYWPFLLLPASRNFFSFCWDIVILFCSSVVKEQCTLLWLSFLVFVFIAYFSWWKKKKDQMAWHCNGVIEAKLTLSGIKGRHVWLSKTSLRCSVMHASLSYAVLQTCEVCCVEVSWCWTLCVLLGKPTPEQTNVHFW